MRIEKDLLGSVEIPADSLIGIHTQRALNNFPINFPVTSSEIITALAKVKLAATLTNFELEFIAEETKSAIVQACEEIIAGQHSEFFLTSALQGGAGTSVNMNVNEVIANRALQILGKNPGDYSVIDPLETINLHQSTNDVFPTAVKVAVIELLQNLSENIAKLQNSFQEKEQAFSDIVKIGRTELQEAVPMTLGSEFSAFAEAIGRDRWRTFKCEERIRVVNLGGTAIGSGLTAPKKYIFAVVDRLRQLTGFNLSRGENLFDQTANADAFVEISGILKATAVNLIKICNDLRQLHFIGEIQLPARQTGSSIMPGKINPVICESVVQIGLKVKANDSIIADAASMGTLQINEFLPLIAHSIIESLNLLDSACNMLIPYVEEITANKEICELNFKNSPSLITVLLPHIGYKKASEIVEEFKASETKSVYDFLYTRLGTDIEKIFSPQYLTALGYK